MNKLLNRFLKEYKVYGPIKSGDDSTFDEIKSINQLHLDYFSTVLPPKKNFHPPKETLYKYEINKSEITFVE